MANKKENASIPRVAIGCPYPGTFRAGVEELSNNLAEKETFDTDPIMKLAF